MSKKMTILVQGAGIGGLALAYWLKRFGFVPTVVERAPSLREGGYMIDFFGLGFDVAERMGLRGKLAEIDHRIAEIQFVDKNDRPRSALDAALVREVLHGRAANILRSELARVLFDAVKDDVEIIFDETTKALVQHEGGVDVTFNSGAQRGFDLVVGADGLHSGIRALVFGDEEQFERHFGYYTASFTIPKSDQASAFASFTVPRRQIGVYPIHDDKLATFFVFASDDRLAYDRRDTGAQIALLREAFAGVGWRTDALLDRAADASDFYFDVVSQVRMPAWSKDRVALIGDACCCPSLLSGQGASLAIAGAYVLAGELNIAAGGYRSAYATYQQIMKPYVDTRQKLAARFASSFVPTSRFGIAVRDLSMRAMKLRPLTSYFVSQFTRDAPTLRPYEDMHP